MGRRESGQAESGAPRADGNSPLGLQFPIANCDDEVGLTVALADGRRERDFWASEKGDATRKGMRDWDVRGGECGARVAERRGWILTVSLLYSFSNVFLRMILFVILLLTSAARGVSETLTIAGDLRDAAHVVPAVFNTLTAWSPAAFDHPPPTVRRTPVPLF